MKLTAVIVGILLGLSTQSFAQSGDYRKTVEDAIEKVRAEGIANITTEPGADAFTQRLAQILSCQDPNWGRKSTNGGPISGDTVAYRLGPLTADGRNTPMRVIDFCVSCGDSNAHFGWLDHGVITNQRFWVVEPTNCSGTPAPNPSPEPNPDEEPTAQEFLEAIRFIIQGQARQIQLLEEQLRQQSAQTEALQKAIGELKTELTKGVKIRF